MTFPLCCCSEDTKSKKIDEVSMPPTMSSDAIHIEDAAPQAFPPGSPSMMENFDTREGLANSDVNVMAEEKQEVSPEEKQAEKDRLRKMSKQFITKAVQGQPCQWLDPTKGGNPQDCIYMIDKTLSAFAIKANGNTLHSFEILDIQDVSKDAAGTPFEDMRVKNFICIPIRGIGSPGSSALQHVGLLFPNSNKQEEFCCCLKLVKKMRSLMSPPTQSR